MGMIPERLWPTASPPSVQVLTVREEIAKRVEMIESLVAFNAMHSAAREAERLAIFIRENAWVAVPG